MKESGGDETPDWMPRNFIAGWRGWSEISDRNEDGRRR